MKTSAGPAGVVSENWRVVWTGFTCRFNCCGCLFLFSFFLFQAQSCDEFSMEAVYRTARKFANCHDLHLPGKKFFFIVMCF